MRCLLLALSLLSAPSGAQLILPKGFKDLTAVPVATLRLGTLLGTRVVSPKGRCGDSGEQFSGYLPAGNASYFFSLIKSARSGPRPVILWFSGGPGCSSSLAEALENGPCVVKGQNMDGTFEMGTNSYAWTEVAHVIWIDQPAEVGYSQGQLSRNEADVANHMYHFIEAFFQHFDDLRSVPFFIFGESFAGHYVPATAARLLAEIRSGNSNLRLDGVGLGNALVNPLVQFTIQPEMACTGGGGSLGHGVVSQQICDEMRSWVPMCREGLLEVQADPRIVKRVLVDRRFSSRDYQVWENVSRCFASPGIIQGKEGLNPYDMRKKCLPGWDLCEDPKEMNPVKAYLNDAKVQQNLGVIRGGDEALKWEPCSKFVDGFFMASSDLFMSFDGDVAALVDGGVPVLGYYGDTDFMCDFIGGKAWMEAMQWSKQGEWNAAPDEDWIAAGKVAGKRRSLGDLTYIQVFNSGHLVPHNQPAVALALISEFIGASSDDEADPDDAAGSWRFPAFLALALLVPVAIAGSLAAFRARNPYHPAEEERYIQIQ